MADLQIETQTELMQTITRIREMITRNELDEALELSVNCYEKAIATENTDAIAHVLRHFAAIEYAKGNLHKSLSFANKSLQLAKDANNHECAISALNSLAGSYGLMGDHRSALDAYMEALELISKYPELDHSKGTFYNNIGLTFQILGNVDAAEKYYTDGLDFVQSSIKRNRNDELIVGILYSNLAEVNILKKRYKVAKDLLKQSRGVALELDDQMGIAACLQLEAIMFQEEGGDWYQAEPKFMEALDYTERYGSENEVVEFLFKYGKQAYKAEELEVAATILDKALQASIENKFTQIELDICGVYEKVVKDLGDYNKAYQLVKRQMEIKDIFAGQWEESHLRQFSAELTAKGDNRQMEELKRTIQTVTILSELGRKITESVYATEIVDSLATAISKVFNLTAFAIGLITPDQEGIDLITLDEGARRDAYRRLDDSSSFVAWCIRNQKELIIYNTSDASSYKDMLPEQLCNRLAHTSIQSALFCPLYHQDEIVGGVTIQSNIKYNFSYVDLALFRLLVSYISIALNNINKSKKLVETNRKLEQAARLDGLTGLLNRRALGEFITREFSKQKAEALPMTMFMIDLDYFKQYNDFYGHNKGDQCLIAISDAIKKAVSNSERHAHAYRYGGDEFLIIIEQCNEQAARAILEDMMAIVRNLNIEHKKSKVVDHVTLTAGACIVKKQVNDYTEIFSQADEALYTAKNKGRNGYYILNVE